MRFPWTTRLEGMALGALTVAAVFLPAPLGAGMRPPSASDPVVWAESCCEPGPPGWVQRVVERLELRMPALGEGDRRTLARTLVVEAEAARIDPLLVLALIEIESSYDPEARSGRGASGLMQLREPTLRREVERAGLDGLDLRDPTVNVRAGIRYLRRLLDAFGREEHALMAYNAGPNRILGYLREGIGEIPERFHVYPRRVKAEVRRLRRAWEAPRPAALVAIADLLPSHGAGVASAAPAR